MFTSGPQTNGQQQKQGEEDTPTYIWINAVITLKDFKLLTVLGKGAFGKVSQ